MRRALSWIYYDPNELILIDFLHMRELIRAGSSGTRAQFDLGRQFCAAMKIDFRGDAWSDCRYNTRIEQGFEALSILAADEHPDRLFLRDLFSACAELLASPDSEHLPYALEEIRRAARTQEEITSESVLNDREHKVRWARWMIGHHHRLLTFPWDTGALAVHFNGLRAIKVYRGTHVERLYQRLAPGKGHGRAVVAVARHLAEASYWVLRKRQPCKDPAPRPVNLDAA